jgi:hypothetical protein
VYVDSDEHDPDEYALWVSELRNLRRVATFEYAGEFLNVNDTYNNERLRWSWLLAHERDRMIDNFHKSVLRWLFYERTNWETRQPVQ